jgi:hypothetical protein
MVAKPSAAMAIAAAAAGSVRARLMVFPTMRRSCNPGFA